MLKTKVAGVFGAACAAGALALTPLAASAGPALDAVVFEGHTTTLTCTSDSPSPLIDFDELVPVVGGTLDGALNCPDGLGAPYLALVGGKGNYQFTTTGGLPFFCAGVSDVGLDGPAPHLSNPCTVNSSGSYRNIVCGTGTATGSAGGTTIDEGDGTVYTVEYNIVFAATVGVVLGIPGNANFPGGITAGGDDTGDPVVGAVVLQGVGPNPGPGGCVSGFNVLGIAATGLPN